MHQRLAALAAVSVLGLAACGDSLDAESIENDARDGFEAAGVTVSEVSCPDEGESGETIECDVTLEDGEEVKLPYDVSDDSVDATDETVEVITGVAARQQGGRQPEQPQEQEEPQEQEQEEEQQEE